MRVRDLAIRVVRKSSRSVDRARHFRDVKVSTMIASIPSAVPKLTSRPLWNSQDSTFWKSTIGRHNMIFKRTRIHSLHALSSVYFRMAPHIYIYPIYIYIYIQYTYIYIQYTYIYIIYIYIIYIYIGQPCSSCFPSCRSWFQDGLGAQMP